MADHGCRFTSGRDGFGPGHGGHGPQVGCRFGSYDERFGVIGGGVWDSFGPRLGYHHFNNHIMADHGCRFGNGRGGIGPGRGGHGPQVGGSGCRFGPQCGNFYGPSGPQYGHHHLNHYAFPHGPHQHGVQHGQHQHGCQHGPRQHGFSHGQHQQSHLFDRSDVEDKKDNKPENDNAILDNESDPQCYRGHCKKDKKHNHGCRFGRGQGGFGQCHSGFGSQGFDFGGRCGIQISGFDGTFGPRLCHQQFHHHAFPHAPHQQSHFCNRSNRSEDTECNMSGSVNEIFSHEYDHQCHRGHCQKDIKHKHHHSKKVHKNSVDPVWTIVEKKDGKFTIRIALCKETKPEDVKLNVKERDIYIEIKMEKRSEDGTSQLSQVFTKKVALPEEVKVGEIKSTLTPEHVIKIEASIPILEEVIIPVIIDEED